MFKSTIFIAAFLAVYGVSAAPKPQFFAPAYVTSQSSQVIARNYNALAAPVVAAPAAPLVAAPAAPLIASPGARLIASPYSAAFPASYVAPAPYASYVF